MGYLKDLEQAGIVSKAVDGVRKAVGKSPLWMKHRSRGIRAHQAGNLGEAEGHFRKAYKAHPDKDSSSAKSIKRSIVNIRKTAKGD